jgi:hypothetical protein
MFARLEKNYTRINSEAQAYQVLRYVMKKQRLRSPGIREDKRVVIIGDLFHIEVGAYYSVSRETSGKTIISIVGKHRFRHFIDVAKNLLLSVNGGDTFVFSIEQDLFGAFTDMSIEEKCFHYLMAYEMLGGDLTKHQYFGTIIEDVSEINSELKECVSEA